jgi:HEAT repeat protein
LIGLLAGATYYGLKADRSHHTQNHEESNQLLKALKGDNVTQKIEVIDHLGNNPQEQYLPELIRLLKNAGSVRIKEHTVKTLSAYSSDKIDRLFTKQLESETNHSLKILMAQELAKRGNKEGLRELLTVLQSDAPALTRRKALQILRDRTGENYGYELLGNTEQNSSALRKWDQYIEGKP